MPWPSLQGRTCGVSCTPMPSASRRTRKALLLRADAGAGLTRGPAGRRPASEQLIPRRCTAAADPAPCAVHRSPTSPGHRWKSPPAPARRPPPAGGGYGNRSPAAGSAPPARPTTPSPPAPS
ncbi:hypothetical protein G6F32_017016 [Rhizopus arrhizus]|nr:hypothetical protein G6F32_017016 [Rhizopus arrhizus]